MLENERTLAAVISRFPAECYDNPTWKGLAYVARDLALYAGTIAALVAFDHPLVLIPLWLLAGLCISALFILGHDAAHGSLFKSKRLAYVVGQICMLPTLHLYELWCYGHNRVHHGHTTREVMDYVWHPTTPDEYRAMTKAQKLAHRLKWSCIGGGIYYLWDIWWKRMILFTPPEKMQPDVRRDRWVVGSFFGFASLSLLTAGALRYPNAIGGALWMWLKVFGVPFLIWNYSIGIVVYVQHIAHDIAWHSRREWTKFAGQMEGTTILHIPAYLNFFYHNIFLHVAHHVDMRIPFYGLPAATETLRKHYGSIVRERAYHPSQYLATTRTCKLFDFDRGVWCNYAGRPYEPIDWDTASDPRSTDKVASKTLTPS